MLTTRVFKAGNSQAVRIPAELAYDSNIKDVSIERRGDQIIIQPERKIKTMEELMAVLNALPTPSEPMQRLPIDMPVRAWTMPDTDGTD